MTLKTYIVKHGAGQLAVEVGRNPTYLRMIANGHRRASAELAIAIESATAGKVRCEDLRPDVDWAYLRGTARTEASELASAGSIEA